MSFKIEELFNEVVTSPLENEDKTKLLTRLFKEGQLVDEVFLLKDDDSDEYEFWKRQENKSNGRTELINTNYTTSEAIATFAKETIKGQAK